MNDESISRQAALDALGERPMLWVDDDNYTLGARNQYDSNRLAIETVPSVDAVPVVRCGECKYMMPNGHCTMFADERIRPSSADFCSAGEWKDGDHHES